MVQCYTFYSYKGGSGRSTTLLNTVKCLIKDLDANPEHPILVVDADLESAGLTYYFGFQDKFKGTLNTGSVLSSYEAVFQSDMRDVVFSLKRPNDKLYTCKGSEAWGDLQKLDAKDPSGGRKISDVFSGIKLSGRHIRMLRNIIDATLHNNNRYFSHGKSIWSLVNDLKKILDSDMDDAKKSEALSDAVVQFLPAISYMDVSKYFCDADSPLDSGTVRFLGTDVSNESRVTRADAEGSISRFLDLCDSYGYRAVVFDSGAGTQASAYVLHSASDVIVYCMRPTLQFIDGTWDNLYRFQEILRSNLNDDPEKKKVILFPNAVPDVSESEKPFCDYSFRYIADMADTFREFVDSTFCTYDECLHEVPLFKWREKILGCTDYHDSANIPELSEAVRKYSFEKEIGDLERYTKVYSKLAERLIHNA